MNHDVKDYCEDHPSNRTYVCVECADETTDSEIAALKASQEKMRRVVEVSIDFRDSMLDMYGAGISMKVYELDDVLDDALDDLAKYTGTEPVNQT